MTTTAAESENTLSKGFTLLGALAFVEDRYGKEARWEMLPKMREEFRQILLGPILPSGWYPFPAQVDVYEAIDSTFGTGELDLCWEIGKFTCDYEMTRIHKVFVRLASLDLWVRSAGLMWGRYYSRGSLEIEDISDLEGRIAIADFDPISKAFCYDFGGWLHRTLELNGGVDVEVSHPSCVLDGASSCQYVGRWRRS